MSFLKRLFCLEDTQASKAPRNSFTIRSGRSEKTDVVFDAWTSGGLDEMLSVLNVKTHMIDRHHLLQSIVKLTYKERSDQFKRKLCKEISELHIREVQLHFKKIAKEVGTIPSVPTFKYYATLLTEDGEHDEAISVCEIAIKLGIPDNTASGFEGRIERIKKKMRK